MDIIARRLECFDEEGQKEALKYLDKCVTKFFQLKVKSQRKRLERDMVDKDHVDDLCVLSMLWFGLITQEEAKKRIRNPNVKVE
jgi:hypothetical protein